MLPEEPSAGNSNKGIFSDTESETSSCNFNRLIESSSYFEPGSSYHGDVSSIADTMLAMSSPDRSQSRGSYEYQSSAAMQGLKRRREGEDFGKALKRSHTLATIRETPTLSSSTASSSSSAAALADVSGHENRRCAETTITAAATEGGREALLKHGHTLRRTVSEGRPGSSHPPR